MSLSCRFYYERLPEIEDTVLVKVTRIADMGAYVTLSEYDNKEGMILLSELSRRRIRSVNKLVRVGKSECVVVIRVDKEKEYIDLSKRRLYEADAKKCEERFAKAKAVNSILRHVATQLEYQSNEQLEELYEKAAWYFDRKENRRAASYDAFKKSLSDPTIFDECNLDPKAKELLLEDIRKKLTPQSVKIRADFEVSCFAYEGVEAVKDALICGKSFSTDTLPIKVNLIAAPLFMITAQTMDKDVGIETVNNALTAIEQKIESYNGTFKLKNGPRVAADTDEKIGPIDEEQENSDKESSTDEDDDGLVAPKGLNELEESAIINRVNIAEDSD